MFYVIKATDILSHTYVPSEKHFKTEYCRRQLLKTYQWNEASLERLCCKSFWTFLGFFIESAWKFSSRYVISSLFYFCTVFDNVSFHVMSRRLGFSTFRTCFEALSPTRGMIRKFMDTMINGIWKFSSCYIIFVFFYLCLIWNCGFMTCVIALGQAVSALGDESLSHMQSCASCAIHYRCECCAVQWHSVV